MKILWRLTAYSWRHKWRLAGAYVAMSGATLFMLIIPKLLGIAIDESLASGLSRNLFLLSCSIILVSLIRGAFSYGQTYLAEAISQRTAYDVRNDLFQKLQSLSFGFHDRQQTGNLMSRATADVEAIRWYMSMGLIRGVSLIIMIIGVSTLLLTTHWRLGLISLIFIPPVIWRAIVMASILRRVWTQVQEETGHMTTVLQENLASMRVVKAFGARKYEEDKFIQRASAVAKHSYAATRLFASQASLMTFTFTIATLVILWYGGREIAAGQLTEGQLAMFVLYMGILAFPVRMTGWLVNTVSRAISAGQRIFEILDADSPVTEKPGAIVMPKTHGHVRFESVSLSYDSHIPAIHDIDLEVLPGQMVALLGSPGSGKSTIVNLVPRFYEVSSGSVTIDGNDVRDVSLASLRRNIGIVLQDTFAFSATIRDNIAYGVDNASLDDVVSAAKVAQLHEFIRGLPDGYDTWVGERGVTLSGGQRQRLAIARTILLSPPILILDDSTSSVDMATEHMIQKAFEEVVKGRTTFVIAHRLSTIRKADQILVLDQGGIMERGTHQELLSRKGYYRRIYDLQLGASVENLANDLTYIPGDDAE